MRRLITALLMAAALSLGTIGSALGHVHIITPLFCVGVEDDGANRTNDTPAALANGGPISGLIPATVGNADLGEGDGGFHTPACPNED